MLKRIYFITVVLMMGGLAARVNAQAPAFSSQPSGTDPWNQSELLSPATLADQIKAGTAPVIFNIGAVDDIKTARHIGAVNDATNLAKFKQAIAGLKRDEVVVIYCGCCKLIKCPNVRPAYNALKAQGFTRIRVLNLETNLKTNWIGMGYPLEGK